MKLIGTFSFVTLSAALLLTAAPGAPRALADEVSPETKQAESAMLLECGKEFPEESSGKAVDALDKWAEASETDSDAEAFKKSRCFEAHEKWEKLAQKNEWAPGSKRMPASEPPIPPAPPAESSPAEVAPVFTAPVAPTLNVPALLTAPGQTSPVVTAPMTAPMTAPLVAPMTAAPASGSP